MEKIKRTFKLILKENFSKLTNDKELKKKDIIQKGDSAIEILRADGYLNAFLSVKNALEVEPQFRKANKIKEVKQYLDNYIELNEFLSYNETNTQKIETIFQEFIKICSYQHISSCIVVKDFNEKSNLFFAVLSGKLVEMELEYQYLYLSLDEYLTYLLRLEIYNEKNLMKKVMEINKELIDLSNTDSIIKYLEINKLYYDVKNMYKIAKEKMNERMITLKNNKNYVTNLSAFIYNTTFVQPNKSSEEKSKNSKKYILPKYIVKKVYNKESVIGDLIIDKPIIYDSILISLEETVLFVIDKNKFKKENFFLYMYNRSVRLLNNSLNDYFLFSYFNKEYFIKKYAKYFTLKIYTKNEHLFLANQSYKNVFLLLEGTVNISVYSSFDQLENVIDNVKYSLNSFKENYSYVSSIKTNEERGKFIKITDVLGTKEFSDESKKMKHISLFTIKKKEIIGTNECYDLIYKNYYFSAFVTSPNAKFLVISKEAFETILKIEPVIRINLMKIVENRFFSIKSTINKFKSLFKFNYSKTHKLFPDINYFKKSTNKFGKNPIQTFEETYMNKTLKEFNFSNSSEKSINRKLLFNPTITSKTWKSAFPKIGVNKLTETSYRNSYSNLNYSKLNTSPNFFRRKPRIHPLDSI